ncbi:MAG: UDP-N-acetylglucosamine-N-acetylmuramyl- (pentapeptide) pyrophosphoryl-UDP N- acetylglucosamine transferase [Candidatus Magasanikbacteria bacterium GW2011_GWD2_43_18]|uniref:UDP-N-acetylglucosamine--N-acetylmuramyl-(pentapeptide) pyrophosphoryl-undecaprenol N-acetylglucosamine transferase n=1 Tax=Candidatus Magasanikbacteria bacterium GW2011_GWE2_42_7 TaxID=1619052 RepID=A0A0G1DNJ9_9BACT|nr:MAG: UDP-N-acetylglucosamine-N-acetylmuramyl- (pentapeptide) pyrophosphoryl-UDP N- acetylglucosamine transferase [Candidatus Magasanikbacteria bacterium GW2011_GWC2_42_27]KKS72386.1 MAG: UDP-N-acetylglucosamine-N-acetylmuramyl- (pentapeptide) pyrophosphoryl-UDP N- acetylglucosamine transferase [Candidatus Magasanikbacteria bacterium GW2011_GWE2_42_7]KKT03920.1 MAG: UDP-N-acetylglucosamine-N-acetylmuramyl- (pentapeptide) pyrophosphoryl-UDP N- acetylglucosamine transferase [Candidatus Magasanikb
MKVLFSGGGTLGPVTPLLAIWDVLQDAHPEAKAVWVGTKHGPEKSLVEKKDILFFTIPSSKLRRYFSPLNIIDVFKMIGAFFAALNLLLHERPDVCISAGGYTSVPVHWAAWWLGIPTWVHQQDVVVGLSNRIMARSATKITTALEASTTLFPKKKTIWLGNPIRKEILSGSKEAAMKQFNLNPTLPLIFVTGGGTGSLRVNQLVVEAVQHLKGFAQVIHLTGRDRPQELVQRAVKHFAYYQIFPFFTDEMKDVYAAADIIISRGGFGTITEIAALGKPAILIPKPGHQEQNVAYLAKADAAVIINETTADGNFLAKKIRELLESPVKKKELGARLQALLPQAAETKILVMFDSIIQK